MSTSRSCSCLIFLTVLREIGRRDFGMSAYELGSDSDEGNPESICCSHGVGGGTTAVFIGEFDLLLVASRIVLDLLNLLNKERVHLAHGSAHEVRRTSAVERGELVVSSFSAATDLDPGRKRVSEPSSTLSAPPVPPRRPASRVPPCPTDSPEIPTPSLHVDPALGTKPRRKRTAPSTGGPAGKEGTRSPPKRSHFRSVSLPKACVRSFGRMIRRG